MRPAPRRLAALAAAFVLLTAAACGDGLERSSTATGDAPGGSVAQLEVVATTAVLGDITPRVVGDAGRVTTLMPPGTDPHAFEPSAAQAHRLREADLVVANGLGLEQGMAELLQAAEDDGTPVLPVAEHLDPRPYALQGPPGDGQALDPHVWLDAGRMASAPGLIARRLEEIAPGAAVGQSAEDYTARLRALDRRVGEILSCVPQRRRVLVTDHDALGYLADAYRMEVVGAVVPGGSTLGQPSARHLAALADTIQQAGVPAVFTDAEVPERIVEALASEVGELPGGGRLQIVDLYTAGLATDDQADTYVEMMTTNAQRIAAALGC